AIVLAGPVANLVLAALLYAGLNLAGTSEPAAILAAPPSSSIAAQAGISEGDQIVAVNQHAVQSWSEARWQLLDVMTAGGQVQLDIRAADGTQKSRSLVFVPGQIEPDGADLMADAGLSLAQPRPKITGVNEGEAGSQADL